MIMIEIMSITILSRVPIDSHMKITKGKYPDHLVDLTQMDTGSKLPRYRQFCPFPNFSNITSCRIGSPIHLFCLFFKTFDSTKYF